MQDTNFQNNLNFTYIYKYIYIYHFASNFKLINNAIKNIYFL